MASSRRRSVVAFLAILAIAIAAIAAYVSWRRTTPPVSPSGREERVGGDRTAAMLAEGGYLLFRSTNLGDAQGHVTLVRRDGSGPRYVTDLTCERVAISASRGVCLSVERGLETQYRAVVFDSRLTWQHSLPLAGIPSRVRVSPDGRRAGITVFVSGDSYAAGAFSTRTTILDTNTGGSLGDLEEYAVTRNGQPFAAVDFNFWGVTFATAGRFYATLASAGRTYLIEGDVDAKTARVVRDDVECPALSPDGTRVAFKKRENAQGRVVFRLHVLDLASGVATPLAETRNVDDQADWLDDRTVIYAVSTAAEPGRTDVWATPADGSPSPRLVIAGGWSPVPIRAN